MLWKDRNQCEENAILFVPQKNTIQFKTQIGLFQNFQSVWKTMFLKAEDICFP